MSERQLLIPSSFVQHLHQRRFRKHGCDQHTQLSEGHTSKFSQAYLVRHAFVSQ